MRLRLTTPLGLTAVLTKAGELYELDLDYPDQPTTDAISAEFESLVRHALAIVELLEGHDLPLSEALRRIRARLTFPSVGRPTRSKQRHRTVDSTRKSRGQRRNPPIREPHSRAGSVFGFVSILDAPPRAGRRPSNLAPGR